jgi:hypothetical protein
MKHRGYEASVNAWAAIGYDYKILILFIHGSGKNGAFKQVDYLKQILEPHNYWSFCAQNSLSPWGRGRAFIYGGRSQILWSQVAGCRIAGLQVAGLQVAGLQVAGLQVAGLQGLHGWTRAKGGWVLLQNPEHSLFSF